MNYKYIFHYFVILAFILFGCEKNPFSSGSSASLVSLDIQHPASKKVLKKVSGTSAIDKVTVVIHATDMDTIREELTLTDSSATGEIEVEKGDARHFAITAISDMDTVFHGKTIQNIKKFKENVQIKLPTVDFSASPQQGSCPLEVRFTDASFSEVGEIVAWNWDFGDGSASTEQNPVHTFSDTGNYDIALRVTDVSGNIFTMKEEEFIRVGPDLSPLVNFTVMTRGLLAHFTDETLTPGSPIETWQWDFGDGAVTDTIKNPYHVYQDAGQYEVTLTVKTTGSEDTYSKSAFVYVVEKPKSDFTANDSQGNSLMGGGTPLFTPLEAHFQDLSYDGSSPITGWEWNFGNGDTSTEQHPVYTYSEAGTYTVQLTVSSKFGSDTKIVKDMIVVNAQGADPPVADFLADDTAGVAPFEVTFNNNTDLKGYPLISYEWDFGDGHISSEENPKYVYQTPGTYSVSLIAKSEGGVDKVVREEYIYVGETTEDFQLLQYGYDDGFPEEWFVAEEKNQMFLTLFDIADYPVFLVEVQMAMAGQDPFELIVLDKETGNILHQEEHVAESQNGAWHTYEINRVELDDDFYVGIRYISEKNEDGFYWPALAFDKSVSEKHSYVYYPDTYWPVLVDELNDPGPGNWLIRITVESQGAAVLKVKPLRYVPFQMTSPPKPVSRNQ